MRRQFIPAGLRSGVEEQRVVRDLFTAVGAVVYSTSDPRVSRSTPGLSDLFVVFPGSRVFLAWETKAGQGAWKEGPTDRRRLTKEQTEFGAFMAQGLTTAFGFGDAEAAKAYLMRGTR